MVNGVALYQSKFGAGLPGTIGQFLTPKFDGTRWLVGFHDPRGYELDIAVHDDERIHLDVCGSDPYGETWTGTYRQFWDGQWDERRLRHRFERGAFAYLGSSSDESFTEDGRLHGEHQYEVKLMETEPYLIAQRFYNPYPYDRDPPYTEHRVLVRENLKCPEL